MQMQDYLPFFHDLFLQYYQFTLENPVYAACLAVAVWLLTTIFYSLRIGFLNRRNRITLKGRLDAQNALAAAQQEIQKLQEESAAGKELVEQEVQRALALEERIAGLAGQLSESIVALAAEPELGQQGLSVSPGLEVEHLWQRFSAAVKQLGESLIAQRKTNNELQQSFSAETAKLAEKDTQLQAMQIRLDNQRQQLAKLELTVEEQKNQLAQQQENSQQSLARIEAKHQIDLARLVTLEQQVQEWAKSKQPQEKPKAPDVAIAQPEQIKPVEIKPAPAQVVAVEPEPKQVKVEPRPAASEMVAPEPTIARVEAVKQKQQAAVVSEAASSGVTGKFKSLFTSAKQQMEKLDDMFGLSTPMLPPEESVQTARIRHEPQSVVSAPIPVAEPEVTRVEQQPETMVKESPGGFAGKFKNLFGSPKAPSPEVASLEEKFMETVQAEPEPEPVAAVEEKIDTAEEAKAPNKLKSLFGKFKRSA